MLKDNKDYKALLERAEKTNKILEEVLEQLKNIGEKLKYRL